MERIVMALNFNLEMFFLLLLLLTHETLINSEVERLIHRYRNFCLIIQDCLLLREPAG